MRSKVTIACFTSFLAISGSVSGQQLEVMIRDADGNALNDAVIELVLADSEKAQYQQPSRQIVDQRDKEFIPTVSLVTVGSDVNFPNSDDILHHVYSFSPAKTFNIPLYGQGDNDDYQETFEQVGIVEIGCNIHDWMLAYIYVSETSLAALSDESGIARIESTLQGEYEFRAWHPRAAGTEDELTYTVNLSQSQTTALEISLELRRDRRVRRAPGSSERRYR